MDPREALELVAATVAADLDDPQAAPGEDEGLVHLVRTPARRAETAPIPDDLPGAVRARLGLIGVEALYRHQEEVLRLARDGAHVVVATGTASGKSLAYLLPVLERLVADETATALYLAPTKALARDQLRAIRALRLPQVRAAALDGDTPRPEREAIRRTANLVLTNPDLLHHSLLPNHRTWGDLLHRLGVVVVDESHTARGVFGGHVGLVLRRLRRLCERYEAAPQFLLASATVGNPAEHAGRLVGADVTAVERDGSPRGPLDLGLWQPPFLDRDAGVRRSALQVTAELLAALVGAEVQTLVFTRSRKAAEIIALAARDRLGTAAAAKRIAAYRAGYLPEERRRLEQRLRSGDLLGVAATEALELGIDVQGLDAVVLSGYPGTVASFWQRLGRAGRTGGAAVGVLVAGDDPLDQYLVHHPEALLERDPEDAIVDPANPYLLAPHLRCACQESPLTDDEATRWFGASAVDLLRADVEAGLLRERGGRYFWISRARASSQVHLRSAGGEPIRIVDADDGALIGDVDEARAHRQVHPGAVYLHLGRQYEVSSLDLERRVALASRSRVGHTTRARSDTDVRVGGVTDEAAWGEIDVRLGPVAVTTQVTGYDVIEPGTGKVLDRVALDLPPQHLRTVAVWWVLPEPVLDGAGLAPRDWPGALHAAEHAAIGLLPLIAMCDRWDLGGLSTALHPDTGTPAVFIYDGYAGGAGLAERSFRRLVEHLSATRDAVAGCGCSSGCPSCVQSPKCGNGNEPLDKRGAVRVLDALLSRAPGAR